MFVMINSILRTARYLKSAVREKVKSTGRSPHWGSVRDEAIAAHGSCAACGSSRRLQVHHVMPFHLHPELELDPANLIVLCMDENECHLRIGHGGSFRCYNPDVVSASASFLASSTEKKRAIIVENCEKGRKVDG